MAGWNVESLDADIKIATITENILHEVINARVFTAITICQGNTTKGNNPSTHPKNSNTKSWREDLHRCKQTALQIA